MKRPVITEKKISPKRRKIVVEWVAETISLVKELRVKRTPREWVDFVDRAARQWQAGSPPNYQKEVSVEDLPILLGCLWGDQICAAHDWQWVTLKYKLPDSTWEGDAVVSPDRSLCILPYAYVHECAKDPRLDVTIGSSIRLIGTKVVPKFPANSYTNLMGGLTRIVPRNA